MSITSRFFILGSVILFSSASSPAQDLTGLNTEHKQLADARSQAATLKKADERIDRLLDLGSWTEASALLTAEKPGHETSLLQAKYLMLQSRFSEADALVTELLTHSHSQEVMLLQTQLLTQAWKLPEAEAMALELVKRNDKSLGAAMALGTVYLLEKNYPKALSQAKQLQAAFPQQAEGYVLEVKVLFASKLGEGSAPLLAKALSLDPLNADAHYYYGYSIWRGGQRTQLAAMQAQWNFTLELNPLYYLVHWHLGNGYTNENWSDYTPVNDPAVLSALKPFDALVAGGKTADALALCAQVRHAYPAAALTYTYAGSAWYGLSSPFLVAADKSTALDSAAANYSAALKIAPFYGPAHNGLASVLNARRLIYLAFADSVKQALLKETPGSGDFTSVFRDLSYYPGKVVPAMVKAELHAATAYLPILALEGKTFSIMPLHHTLAESMHETYFDQATTFDNRKWMDIRGVGSGAAGIEYLVAGAYHERNVLLHEFTHLFHQEVLTDQQRRRIRSLYYAAMKNHATLDYYASNNEDEYFAQAYEAFFDAVKVHPLDYKSMNTRAELKAKDPGAYGFIDSLVKASTAYSAGNQQIFKDNYAQAYANLIGEELGNARPDAVKIKGELEKGAAWNANYLPLLIAKASFALQQKDYTTAETVLRNAETINADYAPVYIGNARLNKALLEEGLLEQAPAFDLENTYYLKAISVERDPQLMAELQLTYLDFLVANAKFGVAIGPAADYAAHGSGTSTYLRDAKEEMGVRALWMKAMLGYSEGLNELSAKATAKPGADICLKLAEAYAANKNYAKAAEGLENLAVHSGGHLGSLAAAHLTVYEAAAGNAAKAGSWYTEMGTPADSSSWYARAMLSAGNGTQALAYLTKLTIPAEPLPRSYYYQTRGQVYLAAKNDKLATADFKSALEQNPYDYTSAAALISIYTRLGKPTEISLLKRHLFEEAIKPGENAL